MKRHYESYLKFKRSSLEIMIIYQCAVTKEEDEMLRDYYQHKFSDELGKQIPKEKIEITPSKGQIKTEETSFEININRPLYGGLYFIHKKADYVLPNLIKDLTNYKKENDLTSLQNRLIGYAVESLNKIINSKFKIIHGQITKI